MFEPPPPTIRRRREWMTARRRRREGEPLKRIAADLNVSPSSVHAWTRDIELTPEQKERNRTGPRAPWNPKVVAARASTWRRLSRRKRLLHQAAGRRAALEGDPVHLAGCMLYWAEGSKSRHRIVFANSDLEMVRLFKVFLEACYGIGPNRLALRLNVYTNNGLTIREIEDHWLARLDLPRSCLRKHSLNHTPTSSSGKRTAKLVYGVATLSVTKSVGIAQHIFGAIQEYGGFEERRWVD